MTTARQKVLAYLKKQRMASAAQIGQALNMSAANVRHHLSVLRSDGRIEVVSETRKSGRGRPVKQYRLSEKLLGDNLAWLADAMLDEWLGKIPASKREAALQALAGGLSAQIGRSQARLPVTKRLAVLVEKLNGLHYQARWEAGAAGPRILFGRCPYAAIIGKHPELCQVDRHMLEQVTGSRTEQLAKIESGPNGPNSCIFLLR